jgi:hypothetical protein
VSTYPDEETRAALWRQQQLNRVDYAVDLWRSLMAPPEPRQDVLDDWMPVILASAEHENPTDPEDDP